MLMHGSLGRRWGVAVYYSTLTLDTVVELGTEKISHVINQYVKHSPNYIPRGYFTVQWVVCGAGRHS